MPNAVLEYPLGAQWATVVGENVKVTKDGFLEPVLLRIRRDCRMPCVKMLENRVLALRIARNVRGANEFQCVIEEVASLLTIAAEHGHGDSD